MASSELVSLRLCSATVDASIRGVRAPLRPSLSELRKSYLASLKTLAIVQISTEQNSTQNYLMRRLMPVVLLLRQMVQPLPQPRHATNRMQPVLARPFDVGTVRDGT